MKVIVCQFLIVTTSLRRKENHSGNREFDDNNLRLLGTWMWSQIMHGKRTRRDESYTVTTRYQWHD